MYRSLISLMPKATAFDPDAQAFITAAAITDSTQQNAINTLVLALKGYSIWTKFKAIYPIVGGTASQHKYNLKDPQDTNGAFRLAFATGVTHSATGMVGNGTTGYANTFLSAPNITLYDAHLSFYSRTQVLATNNIEIGCAMNPNTDQLFNLTITRNTGIASACHTSQAIATHIATATSQTSSQGLFMNNRLGANATDLKVIRNGIILATATTNGTNITTNLPSVFIGALNNFITANNPQFYSTKECAFASIGDGLTDTEAANFYTAVQAFQTTLGRSIGTQTVSDADAQAFVTAAGIVDQVEANAINNLVIGMKAFNIWNDLLAIYPVVGGTATTHKFNLKDPRDLDAAYRLSFSTGWTHSANGMLPNGTSAFANTFLTPNTAMPTGGDSLHYYSRTNSTTNADYLIGGEVGSPLSSLLGLVGKRNATLGANGRGFYNSSNPSSSFLNAIQDNASRDSRGLFSGTSDGANTYFYLKGLQLATNTTLQTFLSRYANELFIGALRNNSGNAINFTNKQCAFAAIGKEMTTTKLVDLNTIVQNFNTTLGRQV